MKQMKNKVIFVNNSIKELRWKDIKHLELQDDDIIRAGWCEPYYSENNSWDGHFYVEIKRPTLETDEQYNKRIKYENFQKKQMEDRQYQNYLRLKKKYEGKELNED